MDKTLFETRAISFFHGLEYVFYDELQKGESIKQMPVGYRATHIAAWALAGFGGFAVNFSSATNDEVKSELAKLGTLCDLIGVKLFTGAVKLVLIVHCDDLSDEAVVGKSHLIRDRLNAFKKFAMRVGWSKMPVVANVFFVFGNSEKAFHFRQSVQEHCKQHTLFSKFFVLPWGVDLSAKSVWGYKGLPLLNFKPTDIEAKLFS
jgi:hypothetical protein